jgi:hypothetical protein
MGFMLRWNVNPIVMLGLDPSILCRRVTASAALMSSGGDPRAKPEGDETWGYFQRLGLPSAVVIALVATMKFE